MNTVATPRPPSERIAGGFLSAEAIHQFVQICAAAILAGQFAVEAATEVADAATGIDHEDGHLRGGTFGHDEADDACLGFREGIVLLQGWEKLGILLLRQSLELLPFLWGGMGITGGEFVEALHDGSIQDGICPLCVMFRPQRTDQRGILCILLQEFAMLSAQAELAENQGDHDYENENDDENENGSLAVGLLHLLHLGAQGLIDV